jgi:hypothetical protein
MSVGLVAIKSNATKRHNLAISAIHPQSHATITPQSLWELVPGTDPLFVVSALDFF